MIISYSQGFIFIKTRKTAGSSLEVGLSRVCNNRDIITPLSVERGEEELRKAEGGQPPSNWAKPLSEHRSFREWRKLIRRGQRAPRFHQHEVAAQIKAMIGNEAWRRCFKFTVERDPWDRAISRYWWQKHRWELRRKAPFPGITEVLKYYAKHKPHWLSNWGHYTIDDRIAVDRVLFYEQLTSDLEELRREADIDGDISLPRKRAKGNHRKDKRHYSEILTEEDRDLIARVCHREIKAFGYTFRDMRSRPIAS